MFLICKNIFLSSESFLKHPVLVLQMQYSLLPFRKHLRWLFFKFFHLSSVPNSSGFFLCLCWLWLSLLWWEFPATVYLTICARHSPLSASPMSHRQGSFQVDGPLLDHLPDMLDPVLLVLDTGGLDRGWELVRVLRWPHSGARIPWVVHLKRNFSVEKQPHSVFNVPSNKWP